MERDVGHYTGLASPVCDYALLDKNLHFVSFFVECDNYEVPGTFYTYIDQFRVITDLSEFTGDETIKDTW